MPSEPRKPRGRCDSTFWTKTRTIQLIKLFELKRDLWDVSRKLYCDRTHKQKLLSDIAEKLKTDTTEVASKLHNLRCQYNGLLRKIKAKKSELGTDDSYVPRWEFFNPLQFLSNAGQQCNTFSNIELLNTSSEDQREQSGSESSKNVPQSTVLPIGSCREKRETSEKLQKESFMNDSIRLLGTTVDSHQIFADYVADQMRNMTIEKQKRLKTLIQMAILEVEEEPDPMDTAIFRPTSPNLPHLSQVISQSDEPQQNNIFGQMASPEANMWREYFAFNSNKNLNTCLVEINEKPCGQEIMGDHCSNLTQHIKRNHGDLFDKITRSKIKQEQALFKNTEAADNYVIINEAELDTIDTDFNYDTDFDPLEVEPNTNYSGKEETTGQHNVETSNSLSCNKQRPIKREMSEEIDLEPKRVCMESTTISENDMIESETEEKNENYLIDSVNVTTFIFKGEEYLQMPKEHYLKEKRNLLSGLRRFKSIINNAKFRLNVQLRFSSH